jgi:hypothetical protein
MVAATCSCSLATTEGSKRRLFSFNERKPTVRNLRKLLELELAALPEADQHRYLQQRQRPRQSNKPLVMHG